ncbi:RNA polymerase sigma factor RpoH [Roseovarius sp. A-2]|uniref:sigma-70 family RNA polymerase sigma factor n=1 Tax=Roseovarius sp. A-2 TaxID=1570360 RepID=UPI0009C9E9D9|nr:sigma-70 family RNA polymerase sigma factor [Roseovarius sp. A-2]GAW35897.1 RNA polymerase sigma factor RpoH [Roseovarius sp. A-2]
MNKPFIPSDPKTHGNRPRPGFLSAQQEQHLARAWQENRDVAARNRLVNAFAPLAMATAKRHSRNKKLDDPDLLQHAYIGLIKAANGFDPEKGFRFSTYAAWWIRAELQEYRIRTWSLVQRTRTAKSRKVFFNLHRLEDDVNAPPGETREARNLRVATALGLEPSELDGFRLAFAGNDSSLNQPAAQGEGDDIIHLLEDPNSNVEQDVADRLDRRTFWKEAKTHFGKLPDRERVIIVSTVLKDPPMTLEQLGTVYGISRERVRQLRERGLERLRHSMRDALGDHRAIPSHG